MTWTKHPKIIGLNLIAVSFSLVDVNYGIILGQDEFIGYDHITLHTTDGGASWSFWSSYLYAYRCFNIQLLDSSNAVAVDSTGQFYFSTDSGYSWPDNPTITRIPLKGIYFKDSHNGWAVGARGTILNTTNGGGLLAVNQQKNISRLPNIALLSNSPNPFNSITEISFNTKRTGLVNLTIYDILGREVATLLNEVRQPGTYTLKWDASTYPAGSYIYSVSLNGMRETGQMLLVK